MIHLHAPRSTQHAGLAPAIARGARRRGFTLVELLITVSIIAIMATMVLFAMFQAQETARIHRTRALITKLNSIIMRRYDEYRTRRVPITFTDAEMANPKRMAKMRLDCLRDLMRMEMPDRWTDVLDDPAAPLTFDRPGGPTIVRPSANTSYRAKWAAVTGDFNLHPEKDENQGAECLYMIVMETLAQEGDSRDTFKPTDVGDVDEDGFPEFIDAWGQPIRFFRWAPGFISDLQMPVRGTISTFSGGGQSAQIQSIGSRWANGASYIGGTLAILDKDAATGLYNINTDKLARITGFTYDPATGQALFSCETPPSTQQPAFQQRAQGAQSETTPAMNDEFVVMPPDSFDSRNIYPIYNGGGSSRPGPDTSMPTFQLYPLIVSNGPDRAFGLAAGGIRYALSGSGDPALNPFFSLQPASYSFGLFAGGIVKDPRALEPRGYPGCHNDNITNHQLSTR